MKRLNHFSSCVEMQQGGVSAAPGQSCKQQSATANYCRGRSKVCGPALQLMCFGALLWISLLPCPSFCMEATEPPATTTYSPKPPTFSRDDCLRSFDTIGQKKYICSKHQDLFPILTYAEQVAKKRCEEDFSSEVWNCSGFSLLRQPSLTSGDNVFNESAYVYALSLAVIAHTVAKGCEQGVVNSPCGDPGTTSCHVEYGLLVAETFLNLRSTGSGSGLKQQLAQHNFDAAKNIIQQIVNSTERKCHCHGVSGSCTFSTCISELPYFELLAKRLKQAYHDSCRVSSNGHSSNVWVSQCGRPVTPMDLIYRDVNNWCEPDHNTGSLGVVGRECSSYPNDPNSCRKLCGTCGKHSTESRLFQEFQCNCKFLFCCEIKCEMCTEQRTLFRCS